MAVDTRIGDYLNDKLQTFADFEALDVLIANVEGQQELLKQQLVEAQHDFELSQHEATEREENARRMAAEFERQQADIDRRLTIITNSDTADDAVVRFEESIRALKKLDITDKYLALLQDVERCEKEARAALHDDPDAAIANFADLQVLGLALLPLQQAAEGAAPHLVDFVSKKTEELQSQIRDELTKEMKQVLDKILWPKKTIALPMSLLEAFNTATSRLLSLQKPTIDRESESAPLPASSKPVKDLFPIQVLIEPMAARFHYHFSGDRPTNRLDKPEYFLNNFFDMLNDHIDFVNEYLQPLLLESFRGSRSILENPIYIDATTAFIHGLLPMVRQRLLSTISPISSQPQLLSHLISELLDFDIKLRDEWRYSPSPNETWKGLTWDLLTQHNIFPRWLQVEKDFALTRYHTIVDDTSALMLDFDSTTYSAHTSVPTTAAIRVHDLLNTITSTYRDVPSYSHRMSFLIEVQIDILDRFHSHLTDSLQAFLTMTSSLGRTVQSVSAQQQSELMGVQGLDRLARVYGSVEHLERAMHDWGDDVFFLDMYSELQPRIRAQNPDGVLKGSLDANQIAEKTSASLAHGGQDDDLGSGALFDETAGSYARLREKTEDVIVDTLRYSVKESLRPYQRSASFASTNTGFNDADLTPSPDIQGVTRILSQCLSFLAKALAAAPLRRVVRSITALIDDFIFERVVLARDFSLQGAKQFNLDVDTILKAMLTALDRKAGAVRLRRTEEGVRLLTLPIEAGDDEMTLWVVEKRLFATNEDARSVLAEMGCTSLSESEARNVLRCRLELSNQ